MGMGRPWLAAQEAAIARCVPGVRYRDVHLESARVLTRWLVDEGLLSDEQRMALLEEVAPANTLVARHNLPSSNGNTLYIHEPNRRTLEGYVTPNVKVIAICIDCPTFRDDGTVAPADLRFELFDPVRITDSRSDTRAIVEQFRDATNRLVGDRYKNGIKVRSWMAQTTAQRVRSVLPTDRETTDTDY